MGLEEEDSIVKLSFAYAQLGHKELPTWISMSQLFRHFRY